MPVRAGFRWAAVLATAVLAGAPLSASCGEPSLEESLRAKAAAAVKAGTLGAFRQEVAGQLAKALAGPEVLTRGARDLETLEHYFNLSLRLDFKCSEETATFLVWLLAQREFCSRFLHALEPTDSPPKAVEVLRRLKAVKGVDEKRYLQHSEMLIAFARVWDTYEWMNWTNLTVPDDRLEEIYEFYMTFGAAMQIPPDRLPHELMVHVIDHPLPKEEREYALGFRNSANLGALFFDIKWIKDETSLYQGHNKSIPYTLMNIKKMNGVCMEQAYYATSIAKCVGVPAAYCCGTGARGGHAWAGVLRFQGGGAVWDFNSGRYSYDHYWKGQVYSPTFRRGMLTDGEVAMTAGLATLPRANVESADARRNLAIFVLSGLADGEAPKPKAAGDSEPEAPALAPERRKLVYDLLQSSVQLNPCSQRTWLVTGIAASRDVFTLQEIQTFSDHLFRTIDPYSPDFVCHTVQRFLASVKDAAARDRLYDVCFAYFRKRPDLAAELKVAQGRRREADGKPDLALKSYLDAVATFPQDGHVTEEAAKSIDAVLAKGDAKKAVETLTSVWRSMESGQQGGKPEDREALRLVGENLLKYLAAAKMDRELAAFEPAFRRLFPAQKK
jgi:hypothetical protein